MLAAPSSRGSARAFSAAAFSAWSAIALSTCSLGIGCAEPRTPQPPGSPGEGGAESWSFETIETRTETVLEEERTIELIRSHRPDGGRTYLLYIHPKTVGAPLVVMNQPYAGIDWTGEEVDARWAALGNGLHPDADAPDYDGDDVIAYEAQPVEVAARSSALHLLNGFAVVHAYGRFYAGGSLEDDILDASAPYHFALSRKDDVDVRRMASFGGSWGGMMALFGASRAPAGVTILSVTPLSPPSDFADVWTWARVRGPAEYPEPARIEAFYSTYLRRVLAATGGAAPSEDPAAWARYQQPAICEGLRALDGGTRVLVPHDEWDVLIPFGATPALVAACPELVHGLYWPRQGTIDYTTAGFDHGAFMNEPGYPSALTLTDLDIALALTRDDQPAVTIAAPEAVASFLQVLRAEQQAGGDVSFATEPLRKLCHPRAAYLGPDGSNGTGASLLSTVLNTVYGTSTTAADVCATLASGLPTPG
ncbi:alpha/beta hydrolase family protein [Chondromyces crocatus]|uniref:Peptidase S9 prolyl oligopeptidase catalytic domain-containing protein n=1 Tax=Chondromyces crocatus TaxID=52 RepID=A0A0K1END7_CHOCO|nr:hypothetical protein [Chondromyces crocatus]AKT42374.1 uncharacterized protein CMC5_066000 [Chondromyces crocatus]